MARIDRLSGRGCDVCDISFSRQKFTSKNSDIKAFPGGEGPYKESKPTKLTFFSGNDVQENIRRLKFAVDTELLCKSMVFFQGN